MNGIIKALLLCAVYIIFSGCGVSALEAGGLVFINGQTAQSSFCVYANDTPPVEFESYEQAADYAAGKSMNDVKVNGVLWHNYPEINPLPYLPEYDEDTAAGGDFVVYQYEKPLDSFEDYGEALAFAKLWSHSSIMGEMVIRDNRKEFCVINSDGSAILAEFAEIADAIGYARRKSGLIVAAAKTGQFSKSDVLWVNSTAGESVIVEGVPHIRQMPELPRGCEVTALAMLLGYNNVFADKMRLAEEVEKSPHRYDDPDNGFIGDMYSFRTHGLGVYHTPIAELAAEYLPRKVIDLSGCEFEDLLYYVANGQPVWIIINSRYRELPASEFVRWSTPEGPVYITYREHSVLITGYDSRYIYIHDPLSGSYVRKARADFIRGWVQMGRQAVVCMPD